MQKDKCVRLRHMLEEILAIEEFITDIDFEDFIKDKKTTRAVIRSLEIIGEAATKLDIDIRQKYSHIPWKDIISLRNVLIHNYAESDDEIIWKVANDDVPELKTQIEQIIKELETMKN